MDQLKKRQVKEHLMILWSWISIKKRSANAMDHKDLLHKEIVYKINYLSEEYHCSNTLLNYVFYLAEQYSHFENYFNSIFDFNGVWFNNDYKKSITLC